MNISIGLDTLIFLLCLPFETDHDATQISATQQMKVVFSDQSIALLDRVQVFQPTDTVLMIQ